jgi:agmatine deiminase
MTHDLESMIRRTPTPGTPAALGYRMPAEWEPHAGTWLSWPHRQDSWPGRFSEVPPIWVEMVRLLSRAETVHILVNEHAPEGEVREQLLRAGVSQSMVRFHEVRTNDAWIRDHGPIFVTGQGQDPIACIDWIYNSWGGKYPPWEDDDRVPSSVAKILGAPIFRPGIVLEGGSIDVNGRGTLLTTESCLLNRNRNPHLSREEIERYLYDFLGASHVLWLGEGIAGDDTDGHVDDLTRFVDPRTVVTVVTEDSGDENFEPLRESLRRLQEMVDQDGQPLRVIPLPMPDPMWWEGMRLPASYANFYIANSVVLVPTFGQDKDRKAIEVLQALFPDREVVGIEARTLVWGLGAFHCVTQQQPAVAERFS